MALPNTSPHQNGEHGDKIERVLQTHKQGLEQLGKVLQQLETELEETKANKMAMERDYRAQIASLKADKQNMAEKLENEAELQNEVRRLTLENLDLRGNTDKLQDQVRLLKRHLKAYQKKLQTGDNFEGSVKENGRNLFPPIDLSPIRKEYRDYLKHRGMLEYRPGDESKICRALIWDLQPGIAVQHLPGLPAYIVFMCVRYTDHLNDDKMVRTLLTEAIRTVKKIMRKKGESDMKVSLMLLSNVLRLLHTFKQYSGVAMFQNENTPTQNEQSLKKFDLSEYRPVLADIAVWIYTSLVKLLEDKIQPLVVPAILENDSGITSQVTVAGRSRSSTMGITSEPGAGGVTKTSLETLSQHLDDTARFLQSFGLDPQVTQQVFRQLFYYICAGALNSLLVRKDLCHWSNGMQIIYNISVLEEWCRKKGMNPEVIASLQPIIQAAELLQAGTAEKDVNVNSICTMCDKLTINQVVTLLNLYTPADFEEKLPMSVIQLVQSRLQEIRRSSDLSPLAGTGSDHLMDTKFSFPVKFPYNPSNIRLEDIEIPEPFNVSHLVKKI